MRLKVFIMKIEQIVKDVCVQTFYSNITLPNHIKHHTQTFYLFINKIEIFHMELIIHKHAL